ncbi:DedA family protein [bacterium]|nr:DedA family protein [Chloroflexi bacterium CFX6]RIL10529.1 MAG: DedA family protein [bacterium]
MEVLKDLVSLVLHVDQHLAEIVRQFGVWTYVILFGIVFLETGIVLTPFLPGDSLLFAAGALAAAYPETLDPVHLFVLLAIAAILGDTANYWIGHHLGPRVFRENVRFLNRENLMRTEAFYEKHGGKTIIIARFVPIIRTFAPFVAGIGSMAYGRFLAFNVIGGLIWTGGFIFAGYYFGNLPVVKENFGLVIVAIIILSLLPPVWEYVQHRRQSAAADAS